MIPICLNIFYFFFQVLNTEYLKPLVRFKNKPVSQKHHLSSTIYIRINPEIIRKKDGFTENCRGPKLHALPERGTTTVDGVAPDLQARSGARQTVSRNLLRGPHQKKNKSISPVLPQGHRRRLWKIDATELINLGTRGAVQTKENRQSCRCLLHDWRGTILFSDSFFCFVNQLFFTGILTL